MANNLNCYSYFKSEFRANNKTKRHMPEINKTDLVLKALYDQRAKNGMIPIISTFRANKQDLSVDELMSITVILQSTRFAVFQNSPKGDKSGAITQKGIDFVLTNSFSKPGTSILKL